MSHYRQDPTYADYYANANTYPIKKPQQQPRQEQFMRDPDTTASVRIATSHGWQDDDRRTNTFKDDTDDFSPSCWSRFKFLIWAIIAIALVGAAIAVAVIMISNNKSTGGPADLDIETTPDFDKPDVGDSYSDKDGTLEIRSNPPFTVPSGWTALWWEEFDGTSLDPRWWSYDKGYGEDYGLWAWGNLEQQYYTDKPENVRVGDGNLYITALKKDTVLPDGYTFKYTSGKVTTAGKVAVFAGMKTKDGRQWKTIRIEASLKSPDSTVGLWAAYWMLPIDKRYGKWASSGEIDIFEMKNDFKQNNMALHYGGPSPKENRRYNLFKPRPGRAPFYESFTTATMDWTSSSISMSLSGEQLFSMKSKDIDPKGYYSVSPGAPPNAPFNIPFYFIINLAVGGKYPGNATEASIFPNTFTVDYIRVFGKET